LADSSFQPERTVVALQYVFKQLTLLRHCSTFAHALAAVEPGARGVVCVHAPEKAGFERMQVACGPGDGSLAHELPRASPSVRRTAARRARRRNPVIALTIGP